MENIKTKITKRPAKKEDIDFARDLYHRAYSDVNVRQFGSWDESRQNDLFDKTWKAEIYEIILSGESFCGYCSIEQRDDYIFVHDLVVSPEFQGRGIGSKILNELIEKSKRINLSIKLYVLKENEARYLYRKLGFEDMGTTNTHIKMEFDPYSKTTGVFL